ncbi:hypothetical protein OGAPHI_000271 [Ogataea philodendri]|uniref:Uncharacterized protein n=1 Tax=Ogataea philodendri TaxID=1378263 RepID=A0A9P8T9P8_9ASCO|nr:uncharacterized protein OGAPHI_000271 [Ogataea philodendri]KAH3671568.1 hypothetical protein OGAPHI_000271 [Ogataea philodendri]
MMESQRKQPPSRTERTDQILAPNVLSRTVDKQSNLQASEILWTVTSHALPHACGDHLRQCRLSGEFYPNPYHHKEYHAGGTYLKMPTS